MPTGYTAGILDGTIETFEQFAKTCMRAMGACAHLRDEPLSAPYKIRKPGDYHSNEIKKAQQELSQLNNISDKDLIEKTRHELQESLNRYKTMKYERKKNRIKVIDMIKAVNAWNPPTSEHDGVKDFMLEQLKQTLEFDFSSTWVDEEIDKSEMILAMLNGKQIREEKQKKLEADLVYHKRELADETKRCNDANKWVKDFLESI